MYYSLPSAESYKDITRDLLRAGKPAYLTREQLQQQQEKARYTGNQETYTGHILTDYEAHSLNQYIDCLNKTQCIATRQYLRDRMHQEFVIIAEEMTASDISKADKLDRERMAAFMARHPRKK